MERLGPLPGSHSQEVAKWAETQHSGRSPGCSRALAGWHRRACFFLRAARRHSTAHLSPSRGTALLRKSLAKDTHCQPEKLGKGVGTAPS